MNQEVIRETPEKSRVSADLLVEGFKLHRDTADTIVSVVTESPAWENPVSDMIRVGKRSLTVPSVQICQMKCNINILT